MFLETFHEDSKRVFRGERVPISPSGHAFGGSADYLGLTAFAAAPPVHLLFRLDMNDPAVGVTLPGIRWLPLLCAIRYGACNLGYRVKSDAEVEILHQKERKAWAGFPCKRYPEKLPTEPVAFREVAFDPGNRKNALSFAGFFGCDALSPDQLEAVTRIVERGPPRDLRIRFARAVSARGKRPPVRAGEAGGRLPGSVLLEPCAPGGAPHVRDLRGRRAQEGPNALGAGLRQPPDHLPDLSRVRGDPVNASMRLNRSRSHAERLFRKVAGRPGRTGLLG